MDRVLSFVGTALHPLGTAYSCWAMLTLNPAGPWWGVLPPFVATCLWAWDWVRS